MGTVSIICKRTEQEKILSDRKRTNILKVAEQRLIHHLLKRLPKYVTPDILTGIGLLGALIVCTAFLLDVTVNQYMLLLGIFGLAVNWFGDSLDGRLAYYRQTPRKWYGFALDIIMDWISLVLTGIGYFFYASADLKIIALLFIVLYGWSMLIALLRYKIVDVYRIDSGVFGPTELRIVIAIILIVEVIFVGSIAYLASLTVLVLSIINLIETRKVLHLGNVRDQKEKTS